MISSQKSIENYIRKIPYGTEKTAKLMRLGLAKNANADNTCPLTTGIFLRIAIEASLEQCMGEKPELPFWRIINEKNSLLKKLSISEKYFSELRNSDNL